MINKFKKAFTLTEVLIAVAIVGVIAALVLPVIITQYQTRVMEYMAERQLQSIKSAMETLTVTENKTRFSETIMAQPSGDDTSGRFLQKYLRVARYFGSPTSGESDAFAPLYYKYETKDGRHQRTEIKRGDLGLEGSCAQLKNGASICMTTQYGGAAKVIMDLNGVKGPNVIGRDLVELQNLPLITDDSVDKGGQLDSIIAEGETPITPAPTPECTSLVSDSSTGCCKWKKQNNRITNMNDVCCQNNLVGPTVAVCTPTVTVKLNYYPTQSSFSSSTKPYTMASSNFMLDPATAVDNFPSSLGVNIKCSDGTYQGGTLSGSTIKSALKSKSDAYWPSNITKKACAHPNETLLWTNGTKTITINGVTYKLEQY